MKEEYPAPVDPIKTIDLTLYRVRTYKIPKTRNRGMFLTNAVESIDAVEKLSREEQDTLAARLRAKAASDRDGLTLEELQTLRALNLVINYR